MRRALKQYFELEGCHSGKKETNEAHFLVNELPAVLALQFISCRTRTHGDKKTLEARWWEYIDEKRLALPKEGAYAPSCLNHAVLAAP